MGHYRQSSSFCFARMATINTLEVVHTRRTIDARCNRRVEFKPTPPEHHSRWKTDCPCPLPKKKRRLRSWGLRRSSASRESRIRPAWRQSAASYRLSRSIARLGRLAVRKKQRANSTAGAPAFSPGTVSMPIELYEAVCALTDSAHRNTG